MTNPNDDDDDDEDEDDLITRIAAIVVSFVVDFHSVLCEQAQSTFKRQ